jgi:hypothetical protein
MTQMGKGEEERATHVLRQPHHLVHRANRFVQMPALGVRVIRVVHAHQPDILLERVGVASDDLPVGGLGDVGDGVGGAPLRARQSAFV